MIDRRLLHRLVLILASLRLTGESGKGAARTVTGVSPELKKSFALADFYTQCIDAAGLPIIASSQVRPEALQEAAYLVDHLLDGRNDLRQAITAAKVRVSIMAANEFTTDIPEHHNLTPRDYWNRRARGLGATLARPSVSCGEENLLLLDGDHYQGENILIHEFAHTIHEIGMQAVDPTFDSRLQASYQRAITNGLWRKSYAATNHKEYWAEGVQSWFDCNRSPDASHNAVRTRSALKRYDPELARLVSEVFGDKPWRYASPRTRADASHVSHLDWKSLPRFSWPADILHAADPKPVPDGEK